LDDLSFSWHLSRLHKSTYYYNYFGYLALEATLWAEKTIEELKKILSDIYPWRKTDKK